MPETVSFGGPCTALSFGDCGCLNHDAVCLKAVHHFNASHRHYGYHGFTCEAWPPLINETGRYNTSCSDDSYSVDASTRYLRRTRTVEWNVVGGPGYPSSQFTETEVSTINKYTGAYSGVVRTVTIHGGDATRDQVNQMIESNRWDGSTAFGACSDTSTVATDSIYDIYGTGTTATRVITNTVDQPHTTADFLTDCATLYAARTLDDLDADYAANGARISNATFNSSGGVIITYGPPDSLGMAGVSAYNYVSDINAADHSTHGVDLMWSGRKCLALAVECVSNAKTVLQRRQVDGCTGIWTDNGTTAIPEMATGDTLGIDIELQFRISDSDWS